jgi:hypothetical protein
MLLTDNDIESELSYAYLHAVASRAGCECRPTGRLSDNAGIDAVIRVRERFGGDSTLTRFTIDVQLKATRQQPVLHGGRYSVWLKAKNYDELRATDADAPQLLIVLFLPDNPAEWLACTEDCLIAKRCAYWQSLYGAPPGAGTGQTIYIPQTNRLYPEDFRVLLARYSREERLPYDAV